MELLNKEHIDKIDNCPLENLNGELKLYRWVDKNKLVESFTPYGFKPKFRNSCIAWGLSTYNSYESAKETLNSLSLSIREKYNAIAFCTVEDKDGIKHQSGKNKNHYTFYPVKNFEPLKSFELIEDEK